MTEGTKPLSSEETDPPRPHDLSPRESPPAQRRKKTRTKRRFSDEQVKSLETIFESETKLEPRKKVQVARELGLQPRQVAIWFQNKRARWKSKQIEKDFRILKAKFDHLKARFESTKEEKESLLSQLQELNNVLQKTQDGSNRSGVFSANSLDIDQARGDTVAGFEENPTADQEEPDHKGAIYSYDDDKSGYIASLGQQEQPDKLSIVDEHISDAFAPPIKWCSFDSGNFFDHPNNSSYWWDSWT